MIIATHIDPKSRKSHQEFFSIKQMPRDARKILNKAEHPAAAETDLYSPSQKLYVVAVMKEGERWIKK